jgi:hypothetical protein
MEACEQTFGEEITYTPDGGSPVTIRAIVDMEFEQVDPATGAIVSSNQPMIGIKDSDLAATPAPGDTCIVRGTEYKVIERREDGQSGTRLMLHLNE